MTATATSMISAAFVPFFIRSVSPAPKHCPVNAQIAVPKELESTQNIPSSFPVTAQAATVSEPKELTEA